MTQLERRNYLIDQLKNEDVRYKNIDIPSDEDSQRALLRGLMNVRMPKAIDDDFLQIQDEYLAKRKSEKGIVKASDIPEIKKGISIWQGDITTLQCDAIVNAANSGMTGCYAPNHKCIDNCIHSFAGVQLRLKCADIMRKQGYEEPTGQAKITKGYNLPCNYVIHTVGPIIYDKVTDKEKALLASCYKSCLNIASENNLESIAFCCISTGVFCFPNDLAAEIAVQTVKEFLNQETSIRKVIFNVFKNVDREIYEKLLGKH